RSCSRVNGARDVGYASSCRSQADRNGDESEDRKTRPALDSGNRRTGLLLTTRPPNQVQPNREIAMVTTNPTPAAYTGPVPGHIPDAKSAAANAGLSTRLWINDSEENGADVGALVLTVRGPESAIRAARLVPDKFRLPKRSARDWSKSGCGLPGVPRAPDCAPMRRSLGGVMTK